MIVGQCLKRQQFFLSSHHPKIALSNSNNPQGGLTVKTGLDSIVFADEGLDLVEEPAVDAGADVETGE